MQTKILYCLTLVLLISISCKKSKDARQLEKYLSNTRWEFYYAEDAQGNDITAQVLQDSVICRCVEFLKDDKDYVTFNTLLSKCQHTFFVDYKGYWVVFDWKKKKKKENVERYANEWQSHGVAIGNMGIETYNVSSYLSHIPFFSKIDDKVMISKRYKLKSTGLPSDSLMEIRYYKKI